jgi:hypothetical protein
MEDPRPIPPETDPHGNLPRTDDGTRATTADSEPAAGDGVTQEAVDAADQPDVDDTLEG